MLFASLLLLFAVVGVEAVVLLVSERGGRCCCCSWEVVLKEVRSVRSREEGASCWRRGCCVEVEVEEEVWRAWRQLRGVLELVDWRCGSAGVLVGVWIKCGGVGRVLEETWRWLTGSRLLRSWLWMLSRVTGGGG